MTATPTTEPTFDARNMVGPGQEGALDDFLQELEQRDTEAQPPVEEEPKLLAGKYKSADDLEKAYQELEKKLGERQPQQAEPEQQAPPTREQQIEGYGEFIVSAAEEEGLDLAAWEAAVRKGEDTAEQREKLAAKTNIPAQLIEQYEAAFRPQQQQSSEPTSQGLTDSDVTELKELVGGDQEFSRLSTWASANLSADELADYNEAVDSGNKVAVRLALRAMQARLTSSTPGEPELISGGRPAQADVFKSQQEAIEAMRKVDGRGRNLYRQDTKYREWFEKTLARSSFPA